jgi:hypothetical protein
MLRFPVSLIMIVGTFAITNLVNAEEKQMEEFKSLKVSMAAPDFTLNDGNGLKHSLRGYLGKKTVVLAFYPKDFTRG